MSWTNSCTESSSFKVKNTQEVKEVLESMGFSIYEKNEELQFFGDSETFFDEDTEVVLSLKPIEINGETKNLIGLVADFICESVDLETLEDDYRVKENEYMVTPIVEYIQDQLLDEKQYLTITCAGFEERCSGSFSPYGDITVITKNTTDFMCLAREQEKILEKLGLNN